MVHFRYVLGSLAELCSSVRCCICGTINPLINEGRGERPVMVFGRQPHLKSSPPTHDCFDPAILQPPPLVTPKALYAFEDGFIIVDDATNRVIQTDRSGNVFKDFAFLHGYTAVGGAVITKQGHVVIALHKGSESCLAYYSLTPTGAVYTNAAYLDDNSRITDLCLASDETILASEKSGRVYVINKRRTIESSFTIQKELGEDFNVCLTSLATDPSSDNIYLVDAGNHCIKVTDKYGKLIFKFGTKGQRPGQFLSPSGICLSSSSRVLVSDRGNQRVQCFTPEGRFRGFVVRYRDGEDVYLAPERVCDVTTSHNDEEVVAVLLTATNLAPCGEVRLYHTL